MFNLSVCVSLLGLGRLPVLQGDGDIHAVQGPHPLHLQVRVLADYPGPAGQAVSKDYYS